MARPSSSARGAREGPAMTGHRRTEVAGGGAARAALEEKARRSGGGQMTCEKGHGGHGAAEGWKLRGGSHDEEAAMLGLEGSHASREGAGRSEGAIDVARRRPRGGAERREAEAALEGERER